MIRTLLVLQVVLLAIVLADRVFVDPLRIDASAGSRSPAVADGVERSAAVGKASREVARDETTRGSVRIPFPTTSIW